MAGRGEWNESLFGCFDDWKTCLCGWCCTPCLFGKNVEQIDDSNCVLWCCVYMCLTECYLCWLPHYFKRVEFRAKYGLREDETCTDLPATICCSPCALCQEARFLKHNRSNPGVVTQTNQPGRSYHL